MGDGDDNLVTVPCDGALIDAAMLLGCLDGSSFSENPMELSIHVYFCTMMYFCIDVYIQ